MRRYVPSILACLTFMIAVAVQADQSAVVGQVTLPTTTLKLTQQSRKELRMILGRLKKTPEKKIITVKGDYEGARNEEEYITKSILMSETVGQYLTESLGPKHEILVSVEKYIPRKSAGNRSRVTVYLMPSDLKVEKVTHERVPLSRLQAEPTTATIVNMAAPASPEVKTPDVPSKTVQSDLPAVAEPTEGPLPKIVAEDKEDYRAAEELVAREKARSAERDKRLASQE